MKVVAQRKGSMERDSGHRGRLAVLLDSTREGGNELCFLRQREARTEVRQGRDGITGNVSQ